ncbi:hypothetical protein BC832DRAFT_538963 [Gaertneriomyces semiglobifer]|nr:hypothetical protein BC832DRAFT_538963 [Gaertneriomyces semiglobifer]
MSRLISAVSTQPAPKLADRGNSHNAASMLHGDLSQKDAPTSWRRTKWSTSSEGSRLPGPRCLRPTLVGQTASLKPCGESLLEANDVCQCQVYLAGIEGTSSLVNEDDRGRMNNRQAPAEHQMLNPSGICSPEEVSRPTDAPYTLECRITADQRSSMYKFIVIKLKRRKCLPPSMQAPLMNVETNVIDLVLTTVSFKGLKVRLFLGDGGMAPPLIKRPTSHRTHPEFQRQETGNHLHLFHGFSKIASFGEERRLAVGVADASLLRNPSPTCTSPRALSIELFNNANEKLWRLQLHPKHHQQKHGDQRQPSSQRAMKQTEKAGHQSVLFAPFGAMPSGTPAPSWSSHNLYPNRFTMGAILKSSTGWHSHKRRSSRLRKRHYGLPVLYATLIMQQNACDESPVKCTSGNTLSGIPPVYARVFDFLTGQNWACSANPSSCTMLVMTISYPGQRETARRRRDSLEPESLDPAKPNKRSCLKGRWIEFTPNIHATLVDVTHHDRHECHWRWLLVADIPGRMLSTRILLGSEPPRILLGTKARLLFLHIRHFLLDISQYIQAANACVRISDGILHNDATRSTAIVQTQNSRSWEELVAHVQLRIKTLQSTSELASASLNLSNHYVAGIVASNVLSTFVDNAGRTKPARASSARNVIYADRFVGVAITAVKYLTSVGYGAAATFVLLAERDAAVNTCSPGIQNATSSRCVFYAVNSCLTVDG